MDFARFRDHEERSLSDQLTPSLLSVVLSFARIFIVVGSLSSSLSSRPKSDALGSKFKQHLDNNNF